MHVILQSCPEVTECRKIMCLEEWVRRGGQCNFLYIGLAAAQGTSEATYRQFRSDIGYKAQINSAILDAKKLMDHGLIRPLGQQRRDRVVASVKDQQQGSNLCRSKFE